MEKEVSFVFDEELYNATSNGDIEKVKNALEKGVSPNACFVDTEESLLSIAAKVEQFYNFRMINCKIFLFYYIFNILGWSFGSC